LPRRPGVWGEWLIACRGGEAAGCNFEVAAPLTDFVLLGNIAIRTGASLDWDGATGRFTNHDAANRLLHQEYRSGWSLPEPAAASAGLREIDGGESGRAEG
jgi:hypothetical protein